MSDEETTEGPKQTVSRLPDDQPDVGPYYPSGMSAPEAALAGATADMSDDEIAKLHGEEPTATPSKTKDSE